MIREERLDKFIQYINLNKFVSVHELCEAFGVSKATVRRDLDYLGKTGMVILSRGGARCVRESEVELPYDEKRRLNQSEKVRIGQRACAMIPEGSTIVLDTGSTTREMVPFLLSRKNLHVLTNDIVIAVELANNCDIDLTVIGGNLRKGFYTLTGFSTEYFLRQLHADIAFLSMDAINSEIGVTITNMDEIGIKQQIISGADRVIALCDHSKFEKKAVLKVCPLEEIDQLITGSELPREIYDRFRTRGVQIQLV